MLDGPRCRMRLVREARVSEACIHKAHPDWDDSQDFSGHSSGKANLAKDDSTVDLKRRSNLLAVFGYDTYFNHWRGGCCEEVEKAAIGVDALAMRKRMQAGHTLVDAQLPGRQMLFLSDLFLGMTGFRSLEQCKTGADKRSPGQLNFVSGLCGGSCASAGSSDALV